MKCEGKYMEDEECNNKRKGWAEESNNKRDMMMKKCKENMKMEGCQEMMEKMEMMKVKEWCSDEKNMKSEKCMKLKELMKEQMEEADCDSQKAKMCVMKCRDCVQCIDNDDPKCNRCQACDPCMEYVECAKRDMEKNDVMARLKKFCGDEENAMDEKCEDMSKMRESYCAKNKDQKRCGDWKEDEKDYGSQMKGMMMMIKGYCMKEKESEACQKMMAVKKKCCEEDLAMCEMKKGRMCKISRDSEMDEDEEGAYKEFMEYCKKNGNDEKCKKAQEIGKKIDQCDKKPEECSKAKEMNEEQLKKLSVWCRKGANAKNEKCEKLAKYKDELKNMEEPSKKDAKLCSNPKNANNKKCAEYKKKMDYQKKAKFCMQEENRSKDFCQKMPEKDDDQTRNKKDFMNTMKEYCMENKESEKCKAFAMKMEKCCEEEGECGVSCEDGEAYDREAKKCMPVACNAANACGEDQKCVPFKAECEQGKFCKQFKCMEECTKDETFDVVKGMCAPMNCNADNACKEGMTCVDDKKAKCDEDAFFCPQFYCAYSFRTFSERCKTLEGDKCAAMGCSYNKKKDTCTAPKAANKIKCKDIKDMDVCRMVGCPVKGKKEKASCKGKSSMKDE